MDYITHHETESCGLLVKVCVPCEAPALPQTELKARLVQVCQRLARQGPDTAGQPL